MLPMGALDVHLDVAIHGGRRPELGRGVDHDLAAIRGTAYGFGVRQVGEDELTAELLEKGGIARGTDEGANSPAHLSEESRHVAADEPGAPGDQSRGRQSVEV